MAPNAKDWIETISNLITDLLDVVSFRTRDRCWKVVLTLSLRIDVEAYTQLRFWDHMLSLGCVNKDINESTLRTCALFI